MGHPRHVAIVQPAVLQYRMPFFSRLIASAHQEDIHIDVFRGETPSAILARADSVNASFIRTLHTREWNIRETALFYRSTAPIRAGGYDLVILEQAVRNLESYELIARMGRRRVAFLGHGLTYTKAVAPRQEALKHWLTQRGKWFFGYTQRGVDTVVERGFPRSRTTVFNNTIDTDALRADLSDVSYGDVVEFSRQHDLRGSTAIYIGALDTYKRISFLLESAEAAHQKRSDFRVLIVGNGSDRPLVEAFTAKNPWAIYLGGLNGRDKALALKAAQAVAIPGAIGLVALDSLVAGVPIVTTDYPFHGPEFDYLVDGLTAVVTRDDVLSYTDGLVNFLSDQHGQKEMRECCEKEALKYSLDHMVESVLTGIKSALDS